MLNSISLDIFTWKKKSEKIYSFIYMYSYILIKIYSEEHKQHPIKLKTSKAALPASSVKVIKAEGQQSETLCFGVGVIVKLVCGSQIFSCLLLSKNVQTFFFAWLTYVITFFFAVATFNFSQYFLTVKHVLRFFFYDLNVFCSNILKSP